MTSARCVYCDDVFNPRRGEGDHVLALRLFGRFKGDKTFRGACEACNNLFGGLEQMVAQSSHLGYFRRIAKPKLTRRPDNSVRQRGSKMAKPPTHTAILDGRTQLVAPADYDPSVRELVDHLVIVSEQGDQHYVKLFRGMRPDQLRAAIEKAGAGISREYRLHCAEDACDEFQSLAMEVLKPTRIEELPPTDPGVRRVRGRDMFEFTSDYFRVLAKIAFHFHLVHNNRRFRGDERYFRDIRRFIRYGDGNRGTFFRLSCSPFRAPVGKIAFGGAVVPLHWCHVLAVLERNNSIAVHLQLYLGPENIPDPDYIQSGEIDGPVVLPDRAWGYVYQIEQGRADNFSGRVFPVILRPV